MRSSALILTLVGFLLGCSQSAEPVIHEQYSDGISAAKANDTDILLIFDWWGNPTRSTEKFLEHLEVKNEISNYTVIFLRVDDERPYNESSETLGTFNRKLQIEKFGSTTQPTYYIVDHEGHIIRGPLEYCSRADFINFLTGSTD